MSIAAKSDLRNRRLGLIAGAVAVAMLGLGYASVPLYRLFCQKTGYGGTPARVSEADAKSARPVLARKISIRFDSNVDPGMGWAFYPEANTQVVRIGARSIAFFVAENLTDRTITGAASYNIAPDNAAVYFTKIQCFCFTQQTLKPHEKVRMPVIFYVDPKLADDSQLNDLSQITLSYTFHPVPGKAPVTGKTPVTGQAGV